jgi:hypothetical protein|tara:strand:+ start:184 stop:1785 length:1602 start_codon:yes stop_codon:yes gene_type:complete
MDERDKLITELMKEKGGTKKQYLELLDSIAYHESAGTMDPTLKQFARKDGRQGPGRGVYQFEKGKNQGGITAARRTKQYYDSLGKSAPKWLDDVLTTDDLDASTLSKKQQDALFLGNMRMHPKANFANVWEGKETMSDFWANYHWAGDKKDRKARVTSFDDSYDHYKKNYTAPVEPTTVINDGLFGNNLPKVSTVKPSAFTMDALVQDIQSKPSQQMAMGGQSGQNTYSDKVVNEFEGGGTHEQNPLGGIPQGMGANGQQNTVEENESSYSFPNGPLKGKFIFSDRIDYTNTKPGQYANGGSMNCGGPGQPPCDNDPKTFLNDYINSPKYKERLESSGYDDTTTQIKKRSNNIKNSNYVEQESKPGLLKQLQHKWDDTPYSNYGSKYDDRLNTVIHDKAQTKELGIEKNSVLAHEYSHTSMDNINKNTKNSRFLLNDYDTNELNKRLKSYRGQTLHDKKPTENKADLDALRYELNNQGIYNAGKSNFTKDHLKKSRNSFLKNRLLRNYSEKDLIWLMNNIAASKKNNNNSRLT